MTVIGKLPPIERLQLPAVLPDPRALASLKEGATNYDPELWELEYVSHRYLGRVDEPALRTRYDGILRNMRAIVSSDRHVIPI